MNDIRDSFLRFVKRIEYKLKNISENELDDIYIERIEVGRGPKIKRVRFVSRSRISHYEKYRAYVKVVLNTK